MSGPKADGARFFIDDADGNRELFHVLDANDNTGGSTEIVNNAEGKPIGSTSSSGSPTLALTVIKNVSVPDEVNWRRKEQTKEVFGFEMQLVGGASQRGERVTFKGCRVANVQSSVSNGQVRQTVNLAFETSDELQPGQ